MSNWTPDDIDWSAFSADRVDSDLLKIAKAAALTESNGALYGLYLSRVFHDEPAFQEKTAVWAAEEVQHGEVLGRWASLADPTFDYADALGRFRAGYTIETEVEGSVRGSKTSEMVARCIVEAGTSSFYTALKDASREPVFSDICRRIAADEFRHYKLFLDTLDILLAREGAGVVRRLMVALGRIRETEDDELSFAYHCANYPDRPYVRETAYKDYAARAFGAYQKVHAQRAAAMVLKAAGLSSQGRLGQLAGSLLWVYMRGKLRTARAA
ncbi:rubrerythrin family protein [Rhodospirillum rubrum]|uniref:ferritin-like domain-containing protein n=1 Tax=Rhodospirillum rubrum TaxID=1085 RepID=UPI001908A18D|nr:ferritin-like domain-containing protein [Rhodospirillum rubrum]MBK1665653.1 rubrerythrin family protein [Rhodospirillum rubrum]MBK1676372.1 rubrerythrin family protein [Rhodospirillum rubrum]